MAKVVTLEWFTQTNAMAKKYIVMAIGVSARAIMDGFKVTPSECIVITRGSSEKLRGYLPYGMKVLRYQFDGKYNLDSIKPIPNDIAQAMLIRNYLIAEAKSNW